MSKVNMTAIAAAVSWLGFSTANAEPVAGLPEFLSEFNYATSQDACFKNEEGNDLQLDDIGIWGIEFGCKFLAFDADKDDVTGEATGIYVARTNCGDDTGVNRPDMITMIFDKEQQKVIVQSQNEFVIAESVRMSGFVNGSKSETPEEPASYVSREYALCETN